MIRVSKLTKTFVTKKSQPGFWGFLKKKQTHSFTAVKNLDLTIDKGEFVALLGPNGAGKTTTLKMLTGILYPTSGDIDVFGFSPFQKKNQFKKMISFVMAQKTQLFLELPVRDTFDFFAEIYAVDKQRYLKTRDTLVERFEIGDKLDTVGRRLSLGQRMKCELICSFLYDPKVIFLDEPTIGLDINSAKEVRKFLKESNKDLGTTIILTTHNMEDVEELCERTIVINKGEKIFDDKTQSLKKIYGEYRVIQFLLHENQTIPTNSAIDQLQRQSAQILKQVNDEIVIKIEQKLSADAISLVLNTFPVKEINFQEEELSDIIAKIYKQ